MAVVELREYKLLSGARQQWLDWMKTSYCLINIPKA
jgi:hypothetical protein